MLARDAFPLGLQKYAEAEKELLSGYEGLKNTEATIPPQGKRHLMDALQLLVHLYEATGNEDEAVKWRGELDKARKAAQQQSPKKY